MKVMSFSLLLALCCIVNSKAFSQVTSVPAAAKENFAQQYPAAQHVDWDNDVVNVSVRFELDGEKMNASYSNKGIWKNTFKDWTYEKLSPAVQDGFKKSKYADRDVTDVKVIYYPGGVEQYRLKVEKNDLEKKYLYFNTKGRLLRESITL
jgi:Putative beta-lactamase-inhibitor-like, PepSY-like